MVRLGIIGLGNMGSAHVASMPRIKRAELAAVCDLDPTKLERYPSVRQFANSTELLRSGEVDAVLIATPHYFHTTIGIEAFSRGVHVLTEKPISVHKADCERLIAAAEATKLKFAAMFNVRTDPRYQRIRRIVRSGELGEIARVSWIVTDWFRSEAYYASGGWRATWRGEGGGVLLNQCPHNLDLLQWICGMPNRISAHCAFGKYHDIEVEDAVTAYLEYPNGATGVFVTTTGEAPGTNRLEIVGDRGKLVFEHGRIHITRTEVSVQEFNRTTPQSFPSIPTWDCEVNVSGQGGQHVEVLQNFIDAILEDVPLIAPAAEGINSVELANAMLLSQWSGAPVNLPMDSAQYEHELMMRVATSKYEKTVVEAEVDMSNSWA